jgi:ribosomal protein S11
VLRYACFRQLMLLLQIERSKTKNSGTLCLSHKKILIEKIERQSNLIKEFEKASNLNHARFFISEIRTSRNFNNAYQNIIKHVLGITIKNTNIIVYMTDVKGTIIFSCTAGLLGIRRKQRRRKVPVLIRLLKYLLSKTNCANRQDLVALHLKNFSEKLTSFTLNFMLEYLNIELVRIGNNHPHNGCRPKKQKRKKRQKLHFG